MFLRFVVADIDRDSQRRLGVFQAIYNLWEEGMLYPDEEDEYETICRWFNENLERPTRFTASKRPYHRKKSKAISWFKERAKEHIARVKRYAQILENHGFPVQVLTAERVGYVVYQDAYQITAEPFADMHC